MKDVNGLKVSVRNCKYVQTETGGYVEKKIYEDLPDFVTGTIINNTYPGASKYCILVDGYSNKRSKYMGYYFRKCNVDLRPELDLKTQLEAVVCKMYAECKSVGETFHIFNVVTKVNEEQMLGLLKRKLKNA